MADLNPAEQAAVDALMADAGCTRERAIALARGVARVAAEEALELMAGTEQVYGSVVDGRVSRLRRLIDALPAGEPLPNAYEVGAAFRITVSQARTVLRTYEARFSKAHRGRMSRALNAIKPKALDRDGTAVWKWEFGDPVLLDYAVEVLRRRGLVRSVTPERRELELYVDRAEKDRHGKDAVEALRDAGNS